MSDDALRAAELRWRASGAPLDHASWVVAALRAGQGAQLEARLQLSPTAYTTGEAELAELLARLGPHLRPGFESGPASRWTYDPTEDLGLGELRDTRRARRGEGETGLDVTVHTSRIEDGMTPASSTVHLTARGLPPGCMLSGSASLVSPAYGGSIGASVVVRGPRDALEAIALDLRSAGRAPQPQVAWSPLPR